MKNQEHFRAETPKLEGLKTVGFVDLQTTGKKETLKIHKNKGLLAASLKNKQIKAEKEATAKAELEAQKEAELDQAYMDCALARLAKKFKGTH